MVKADLGIKRVCPNCSVRFYDLQKRPIECPKCSFTFEPEALYKQRRPRQPEPAVAVAAVAESDDEEETDEEAEEVEAEEVEETLVEAEPVLVADETEDDEIVEADDPGVTVVEPGCRRGARRPRRRNRRKTKKPMRFSKEVEDDRRRRYRHHRCRY